MESETRKGSHILENGNAGVRGILLLLFQVSYA